MPTDALPAWLEKHELRRTGRTGRRVV